MKALQYPRYGAPEVLEVGEANAPHAAAGQVRIAVRAASVNPFDWKLRAGYMDGIVPVNFPAITGTDAAGVVDEVGHDVESVRVGDPAFGLGSGTTAEYAVLDVVARIPSGVSFEQAAALGLVVETAARTLDLLKLPAGGTLVVDGAAGGVGTAITQFAVARGLHVIGTASPSRHAYLQELGAIPTIYGSGLQDRVAELAPNGVVGCIDVVGKGSVPELIKIAGDPSRVATVADFAAGGLGVHVADASRGRAGHALAEAASLLAAGKFVMPVAAVYPLAEGAEAHRISETGHARGKIVISVP